MGGCNQSCPNLKCKPQWEKITKREHVDKLILVRNIINDQKEDIGH